MAERFERSIQDWYQNSRTADLEFLNLANPNLSDLSNNITILYEARTAVEQLCTMLRHTTEHIRQQIQQAQDEETLWAATQETRQAEEQQRAVERICKQLAQLLEEQA